MTRQELFEHYSFYVDEMEINDPIAFDLWVLEYLTDLEEVFK